MAEQAFLHDVRVRSKICCIWGLFIQQPATSVSNGQWTSYANFSRRALMISGEGREKKMLDWGKYSTSAKRFYVATQIQFLFPSLTVSMHHAASFFFLNENLHVKCYGHRNLSETDVWRRKKADLYEEGKLGRHGRLDGKWGEREGSCEHHLMRARLSSDSRCWWTDGGRRTVRALHRQAASYGVEDWAVPEAGLQRSR